MPHTREDGVSTLESDIFRHLLDYFPVDTALRSATEMYSFIRLGIARALDHGFKTGEQACRYLQFMIVLGSDFDCDPLLPWVPPVLASKEKSEWRLRRLCELTVAHQNLVAGRSGEHQLGAFRRAARSSRRLLEMAHSPKEACALLAEIHPRKHRLVEDKLPALMEAANQAVLAYTGSEKGTALYGAMMFLLGIRFDRDPLLPWACCALSSEKKSARMRLLHDAALEELERALALQVLRREE